MRPLVITAAAGLLAAGQTLATDYGRERSLRVSSEARFELETTSFEMKVDGEPVERPDGGPGGMSSSLVRKAVLVDRVLEARSGRPSKVRRAFEVLAETSETSFGGEPRQDERAGPLQGVVVELARADDGGTSCEVVEGERPAEAALLEGHELALGLDALLPPEEVERGASWALEGEAVLRALASALDPRLFPELPPPEGWGGGRGPGERGGGRPGRGPRGGPARLLAGLEWQGRATLAETETEHGGEPCAALSLEIQGQGEMPEPRFRGPRGGRSFEPGSIAPPGPRGGTIRVSLEGKLYFSSARAVPVALELEGEIAAESSFEGDRDGHAFSTHSTQEGDLTLTVTIAEE